MWWTLSHFLSFQYTWHFASHVGVLLRIRYLMLDNYSRPHSYQGWKSEIPWVGSFSRIFCKRFFILDIQNPRGVTFIHYPPTNVFFLQSGGCKCIPPSSFNVLRSSFSILRSSFSVFRSSFSVIRSSSVFFVHRSVLFVLRSMFFVFHSSFSRVYKRSKGWNK